MAKTLRIALVSPSADALSETFIQRHKNELEAEVFHYYNGHLPTHLEGKGPLLKLDLQNRIKRKLKSQKFDDLALQAFYDSLIEEKIDVVLAEYGPTGVRILEACKAAAVPLVVHFHGYDASKTAIIEKYRSSYTELFNYASFIVGVSKVMLDNLISMGAAKEKLVYAPCQPDRSFLKISPKRPAPARFFFVGRFVDKKAPYYLLLAFKLAMEKGMKATMLLAGDGPLWNSTKNLCAALGLDEYVDIPGGIAHARVLDELENCTAYVQHSIRAADGDTEGTPVAVMEASAAGIPVVSTLHAGIPDVIDDGVTGILVNEHAFEAMGEALFRLANDQALAKSMGAKAKAKMDLWLHNESSMDKLDDCLQKAVKR